MFRLRVFLNRTLARESNAGVKVIQNLCRDSVIRAVLAWCVLKSFQQNGSVADLLQMQGISASNILGDCGMKIRAQL